MKQFNCTELLDQLQADVQQIILAAKYLQSVDPAILLQEPAPGKWSVMQVLEHLNSYGRYYLLAIERSLKEDKPAVTTFTPGWVGDYFTRLMMPGKNGKLAFKMQAPKDHRPSKYLEVFPVLNTFLEQQHYLTELLELAKSKNIGKIRTPISISKLVKLKVGDTFRFLIAHEQRHFAQIEHALTSIKEFTGKFPVAHRAM